MKKSIFLMAGLAVAAISTTASAATLSGSTTVVRVTGSTAFRSSVDAALKSTALGFSTVECADASSSGSANHANYYNSTTDTLVKVSWSGSVGGVFTVSQQSVLPTYFPTLDTTGLSSTTTLAADTTAPDIAFSDVYQSSTPFTSPSLVDNIVGINEFRIVAGYTSHTGGNPVKAINYQQLRALYSTGHLALSQITGNASDSGIVVAEGRDPDSGTRMSLLAEIGSGPLATIHQYKPTEGGTNINQWAAGTLATTGASYPTGMLGEASGSGVANDLRIDSNTITSVDGTAVTVPVYTIGYLSIGDSETATGASTGGTGDGNCTIVQLENSDVAANVYPTVTKTVEQQNLAAEIINGSHPYWSYEHAYYLAGHISTTATGVYTALVGYMQDLTNTGTGTVKFIWAGDGGQSSNANTYGNMNVYRASDGGQILSIH